MADSFRGQPIRSESADWNSMVRSGRVGHLHKGQRNGADSSAYAVPDGRPSDSGQGPRILVNVPEPSLSPHPQRIRHPINIVKPRRNQRDLQNPAIVKSHRPQPLNIVLPDLCRILGQLDHIIHHHLLLRRDRRGRVIRLQRLHQLPVQRHPTQKLCVRLDSIHAPVGHRDHGRNHFMLPPAQRQLRRHQGPKGSERMIERLRNQRV